MTPASKVPTFNGKKRTFTAREKKEKVTFVSGRDDLCQYCGDPFFVCPRSIRRGREYVYRSLTCCGRDIPCSHHNPETEPKGRKL